MISQYIEKNLILLDDDSLDRQELFQKVALKLTKKGYVKEGFKEFLNNREDDYPTGLELGYSNVAIPHGDPSFVNHPFIMVVRLKESIIMNRMDDPEVSIPVKMLFILGLNSGENHLLILKTLMKKIQNEAFINEILNASSEEGIISLLSEKTEGKEHEKN
ncbi:PTS sugar transporter subunit IIA [Streptococcus porcinus]|uniref:Phosphoenolpyruvate-dependent sugar phosphotransferase system n=2 Tax=Streptococcus porcinus TaxID=1340 RepID=A0A4V6LXT3_STRPO|nr:PTS sugar transporter subunit IIA [Streptococcus porcinus]EGJ26844.1 phosphoenolpyruvate-dependent sugar PTS family porter, EIIA 2 [Streptococcus porcinus str. Jelinkova 176]SQG42558.1 phosphoenolpyruvate-dependent sugar phosphotransferase system [Streptococcus porcinus]VTT41599.1 phosphoenolpyruvate-dependent sugar phosphotransferase system [Streptococcus porcinus]VTT42606.1 phosphoenolpyruvate-dependent sugar phosphotransferase system [Streptococcus porcinus]